MKLKPHSKFLHLSLALCLLWGSAGSFPAGAASGQEEPQPQPEPQEDALGPHLSVFYDALHLVRAAYLKEPALRDLMAGALDSVTDALDPFSVYVPVEEIDAFRRAREIGSSRSGLVVVRQQGFLYVASVVPGSPAAEAGIETGDFISELEGQVTRMMPMWKVSQILTEDPGDKIGLQVIRQGEPVEISLSLASFPLPGVELHEVEGEAVLRVGHLSGGAPASVGKVLDQLHSQDRRRLILDLRQVASGEAEVAYQVADLFARGELGVLQARSGVIRSFTADDAVHWQGKLVVLVDRSTLGPAEILATVLRQKLGAELVGGWTFGYAGHQELVELSEGGWLLLADSFYTGPDGKSMNQRLKPDLMVRRGRRPSPDSPEDDLILKRGLERLRGETEDGKEDEPAV